MNATPTLLVIGIHREELAFGRAVAEGLDSAEVTVLTISEGISGKRPLASQRFRYETLHRALYLQLLPHVLGCHELLIDLHTGFDPLGPSADLFCADAALRTRLEAAISNNVRMTAHGIRVIPVGADTAIPHARTVIPREIWENPAFHYVGMEIYLPEMAEGQDLAQELARELLGIVADCVTHDHYHGTAHDSAQQGTTVHAQMNAQAGNENPSGNGVPTFLPAGRERKGSG